jgi:hypothetical protein
VVQSTIGNALMLLWNAVVAEEQLEVKSDDAESQSTPRSSKDGDDSESVLMIRFRVKEAGGESEEKRRRGRERIANDEDMASLYHTQNGVMI